MLAAFLAQVADRNDGWNFAHGRTPEGTSNSTVSEYPAPHEMLERAPNGLAVQLRARRRVESPWGGIACNGFSQADRRKETCIHCSAEIEPTHIGKGNSAQANSRSGLFDFNQLGHSEKVGGILVDLGDSCQLAARPPEQIGRKDQVLCFVQHQDSAAHLMKD